MGFKKQFYHFNLIYIYWFDSAGLAIIIATGNMNDYADSDSAVACNMILLRPPSQFVFASFLAAKNLDSDPVITPAAVSYGFTP